MKNKNYFKLNFIYFTAMICVAIIFVLGYNGIITNDIFSSFLIQIVVMFAIPLIMYTLLISKNKKQTLKDVGLKKISAKMIGITVLIGLVLYFINSFVANVFSSIISLFGYENLYQATTVKLTYKLLLKEFLLSAVLPGICEEFLHRGIMLFAGKKYANPRICLFASSILFGFMHLNINQFFYAAILGCLMGYVALVADSIIPSMIIHFMNNFLSSYFYYGYYLNWPFARFVETITSTLAKNVFVYVFSTTVLVILLIFAYYILVTMLARERAKNDVKKILISLELEKLPLSEAQEKINQANLILNLAWAKNNNLRLEKKSACKTSFLDKVFLISSLVLGCLITISTFIWGII